MQVKPLTPVSHSAAISYSGIPHKPNPPTAMVWLSLTISANADLAFSYTLLFIIYPPDKTKIEQINRLIINYPKIINILQSKLPNSQGGSLFTILTDSSVNVRNIIKSF